MRVDLLLDAVTLDADTRRSSSVIFVFPLTHHTLVIRPPHLSPAKVLARSDEAG
jgi:hypothetical protein